MLVVYVGGAIGREVYVARSKTEPVAVREPFVLAMAGAKLSAVDLLVCPCPIDTQGEGFEWFPQHLESELIPSLTANADQRALVGYSAGAAHALYASVLDDDVTCGALLGAAGVPEVLKELAGVLGSRQRAGRSLAVAHFHNADDGVQPPASYRTMLSAPLLPRIFRTGVGGHPFADYVANGSVEEAFRFVLEQLTQ